MGPIRGAGRPAQRRGDDASPVPGLLQGTRPIGPDSRRWLRPIGSLELERVSVSSDWPEGVRAGGAACLKAASQ